MVVGRVIGVRKVFDIFGHIAITEDIALCTSVNESLDFYFSNADFHFFWQLEMVWIL